MTHQYPLTLTFRFVALSPELQVTDATGAVLMQVKQKLLTLREDTTVFADAAKTVPIYRMKADRVIGFRAVHRVTRVADGHEVGAVRAAGLRSIWRARYDVTDGTGTPVLSVQEENPWVKVVDALIGEIPILGDLAGMFISPTYVMLDSTGTPVFRIVKRRSFIERRFILERVGTAELGVDPDLVALALIQVVMLERERG